jgi:hypothetical protein
MPETIPLTELVNKTRRHDHTDNDEKWLEWATICLVSQDTHNPELMKPEAVVHMTINGVEVKFTELLKRIATEFDRQVVIKAKELMGEQFEGIESVMSEVRQELDDVLDRLRKRVEEAGV